MCANKWPRIAACGGGTFVMRVTIDPEWLIDYAGSVCSCYGAIDK